ncbi:MAG: type II secretion system minor pseudopilin GspK [Gammaproteobacteria bacterium]|nr:type II secretion system minor pseudopilin GspK [Gammaproteobacteria bacterium]
MRNKQVSKAKQTGVAVITAVLVLAIAATAATSIAENYQLDFRRSENTITSSQAWAYAKGAEQWTMAILARDGNDNSYDGLDEPWWNNDQPIFLPLPGGFIEGKIADAQSKLNLNKLVEGDKVNETTKQRVSRLFVLLDINPNLVGAIIDWIDTNVNPTGADGAERDIYIGLEFAYLPADQSMADVSELRLIRGFDQEIYDKLIPHVTALHSEAALNLNTATAEVLASLHPKITLELANDLVEDREDNPYKQVVDFLQHPFLQAQSITIDTFNLSVSSNYFDLDTKAVIGKSKVRLTSTIHRPGGDRLRVVKRSQKL